jgi:hypothetical protein
MSGADEITARLPTVGHAEVWHVGTMDPGDKRRQSWEGMGLSVSRHPHGWVKICDGHVRGDFWRLEKPTAAFVDMIALRWREEFADVRKALVRWGVEQGLLVEMGMPDPWGTDKLFARVGMDKEHGSALTFAVAVFVEENTDLDGCWWEYPVEIKRGANGKAPVGVIVPARVDTWRAERADAASAPDAPRRRRARPAERGPGAEPTDDVVQPPAPGR